MPTWTPRAITHEDLAPKPRGLNLASKAGALLTILCILFGLLSFILSLFAEATRSEVIWIPKGKSTSNGYECVYIGSGKVPLICAAVAFVALAIAMLVQHSFMLIAIIKVDPLSWDPQSSNPLTRQASFFFISTWICFAVGEIMLSIGLSVESGHLKDWATPRPNCLIIREGVFTSAGVFSLLTVFLAAGLYVTMLKAQWACQEQENIRREVLENSALYASPPRSPRHNPMAHNPSTNVVRQNQTVQVTSLSEYQSAIGHKQANVV